MTHFEEMKALFEKMGLDIIVASDNGMIEVLDNMANKAEFTFNPDGSFSQTGYYEEPE